MSSQVQPQVKFSSLTWLRKNRTPRVVVYTWSGSAQLPAQRLSKTTLSIPAGVKSAPWARGLTFYTSKRVSSTRFWISRTRSLSLLSLFGRCKEPIDCPCSKYWRFSSFGSCVEDFEGGPMRCDDEEISI